MADTGEHAATRTEIEAQRISDTREGKAIAGKVAGTGSKSDRPSATENPRAQLRLHVLASGSKGNCSVVENVATGECVVIDCGISKRAFMERLDSCGVEPARIQAILVTHEHTDHTKGLGVMTRGLAKLGVHPTLFASDLVHRASADIRAIENAVDLQHFARGDMLSIAGMGVHAFTTSHDAAESFGFRFECCGDTLGFMTDTGIVTGEALEALTACRLLAIEANHDPDMLEHGPYPYHLKVRIASEKGHLSNVQSSELLGKLLCNEVEQVVGLHVSENNNTYRLPVQALDGVLRREGHPALASVGFQNRPISV